MAISSRNHRRRVHLNIQIDEENPAHEKHVKKKAMKVPIEGGKTHQTSDQTLNQDSDSNVTHLALLVQLLDLLHVFGSSELFIGQLQDWWPPSISPLAPLAPPAL